MPQTTYQLNQPKGFEGTIANTEPYNARSYYNASGGVIPFGRVLVKSSAANSAATLPSATGGKVVGVAVANGIYEQVNSLSNQQGYSDKKDMNVLTRGVVYLVAEGTVTAEGAVYYRHTANSTPGTYEAIGRVRADADTSRADLISGAKFLDSGVAGDIVRVAFNLV